MSSDSVTIGSRLRILHNFKDDMPPALDAQRTYRSFAVTNMSAGTTVWYVAW